jgi:hypothetical protein
VGNVELLFNIVAEPATDLAHRDNEDVTRSSVFATSPDALCVGFDCG